MPKFVTHAAFVLLLSLEGSLALAPSGGTAASRRTALGWMGGACATATGVTAGLVTGINPALADVDTDDFLRTGMVSMPMGVSGQAGKAKPQTGVVFRDGTEVSRDARSGDVLAEILVKNGGSSSDMIPVVASFTSPWPLATGSLFDVECRDSESGDGAFLAVSPSVGGTPLEDLKDSFFSKALFSSTGRFSFYGPPTDIKVKTSKTEGGYRILDIGFSNLSQSTQTEIPRKARVVATIPSGSDQVVMLVGSASALRWKKGADKKVLAAVESFRATVAPQTGLKVRARDTSS